ncbi:hypothetical protein T492DRAFT_918709 [Pavlovales sp. CCMP2436]|nr:hypothetical protein T492DRAFT_918709 [Pavlovales sp. CCMP2436]
MSYSKLAGNRQGLFFSFFDSNHTFICMYKYLQIYPILLMPILRFIYAYKYTNRHHTLAPS